MTFDQILWGFCLALLTLGGVGMGLALVGGF